MFFVKIMDRLLDREVHPAFKGAVLPHFYAVGGSTTTDNNNGQGQQQQQQQQQPRAPLMAMPPRQQQMVGNENNFPKQVLIRKR